MTRVELLAVLLVMVVIVATFFLLIPTHDHREMRLRKDAWQLRGIHQAMAAWSQNNRDSYPLPSAVDVANATVPEQAEAKDTTQNVFSLLVWNGFVGLDILVSPLEQNPAIKIFDNYEFEAPKAAVDPTKAQWDPAFSADFGSPKGGHISFAHMPPVGPRRPHWMGTAKWNQTFRTSLAVVGDRGPQITSATAGTGTSVSFTLANPKSLALRMYGDGKSWRGNIAFSDSHVDFLTSPKGGTYMTAGGSERDDLLFFDEPDDPKGLNAFLGIFPKAGPEPKDFKAIWD